MVHWKPLVKTKTEDGKGYAAISEVRGRIVVAVQPWGDWRYVVMRRDGTGVEPWDIRIRGKVAVVQGNSCRSFGDAVDAVLR
jgi:hypothetical protein